MESAGLRRRRELSLQPEITSNEEVGSDASEDGDEPPRYTIDLSLPPRKRYQHVVADFGPQIATLPILFDEVVKDLRVNISVEKVRWLARLLLRRVYNKEENEELRGVQEATGVEMYLLVALNVLLDLFMGCTSGAVKVGDDGKNSRMLHFRTLDWGMDALRKVIVHLDFVERPGGDVIVSVFGSHALSWDKNLETCLWVGCSTFETYSRPMFTPRLDSTDYQIEIRLRVSLTLGLLGY